MKNIKSIFLHYLNDVIGSGIYDILKFLIGFILAPSITVSISSIILRRLTGDIGLIVFIIILLLTISIIIYIVIYKKYRKYKFRILSTKINLEYLEDKIIVTNEITVKARRSGLDRIYHRYSWFEDEKSAVRCLTKGFLISRLPRKDTSHEYYVNFNRKLKRGETIVYKVKITSSNLNRHFKNFYSREVIAPLDYLFINIVIPSKYRVNEITRSIIKGSPYNDYLEVEKLPFLNSHTWEINNPRLGWEYKLSW